MAGTGNMEVPPLPASRGNNTARIRPGMADKPSVINKESLIPTTIAEESLIPRTRLVPTVALHTLRTVHGALLNWHLVNYKLIGCID